MLTKAYTLAFLVGLYDYVVKGLIDFYKLPCIAQGWSWHLLIFAMFLVGVLVIWKACSGDWWQLVGMVLVFPVEDVLYYVVKSMVKGTLCWNSWLFSSAYVYIGVVVLSLLVSVMLYFKAWRKI